MNELHDSLYSYIFFLYLFLYITMRIAFLILGPTINSTHCYEIILSFENMYIAFYIHQALF